MNELASFLKFNGKPNIAFISILFTENLRTNATGEQLANLKHLSSWDLTDFAMSKDFPFTGVSLLPQFLSMCLFFLMVSH